MVWIVYFWAVATLLVVPLPFKIAGYASGRDTSPKAVKIEEMANLAFFLVGLAGLYSYVYRTHLLTPVVWKAWVALAIVVSLVGLVWSPKLTYAVGVMGKSRTRLAIAAGFVAFLPMLVGVWRAGA